MVRLQRYVYLLCTALSLMMAVPASAQSTVSLTSSSGHPGDEVEVSVMLSNALSATALQINIPHSSYLSYVDGSAVLNTQRVSASHSLSVSDDNNLLNLYVYDLSLNTFREGTGALITFRLKLGTEPAAYVLKPEVILSDASGTSLPVSTQAGNVTILSPKISLGMTELDFGNVPIRSTYKKEVSVGNVGNETLTISDVTSGSPLFKASPTSMTIGAGQQKALTIEYCPQNEGNDATDITLVSDAVNGNKTIHVTAAPFSVNTLSVANASGQTGEEVTIHVSMQNMEPIVAVQCCFTLPDALSYVEGSAVLSGRTSNGSHQISGTVQGNKLSFFILSESNVALSGNEGELFTFKLLLNGTGGDYPLTPEDVLLSSIAGRDMTSEVNGAVIRIAAPKLVCASELDFGRVTMAETIKRPFAIRNSGESPLTIERIDFSDEAFSVTNAANLPTIAVGQTVELEVCYHPSEDGTFTCIMQVYSDDPQNRMQVVDIKGETYFPNQLALSGMAVDGQPDRYAVTVSMQNSLPIAGMQFDLHWIAGMAPVQETVTMSTRATDYKASMTKQGDNSYRVYLYSENNTPIVPGNGPVVTFIYNKVEGQVSYDKTSILADQIVLSTTDGRNCTSTPTASLTIGDQSGLLGDANNDGQVTVADVTCIINYLLELDSTGFIMSQADMNQDQRITITDAVELIYAILHQ